MSQYLLLISVGPVQDFIASARRTRDLWFGSWLLSEVSKAVAKELHSQHPDCLIFPAPESPNTDLTPKSDFAVANVILARLRASKEETKGLAEKATNAAKDRLMTLANEVLENYYTLLPLQDKTVQKQLEDMLEFNWTAVETADEGYKGDRDYLYTLLAARKTTRNFVQPSWGSSFPKSSLDGQRESVLPRLLSKQNRIKMGLREAEELCGVGLLKRLGVRSQEQQKKFASTSQMAAGPILERAKESGEKYNALQTYIRQINALKDSDAYSEKGSFGELDLDGAILYESRLKEYLDLEDGDPNSKAILEQAKKHLKSLLKALRYEGEISLEPLPYYALYHADGDFMGEAIDHHPNRHRELSQALAQFATSVDGIVAGFGGTTVYSGGDDVLALLPLHKALECTKKLSDDFKDKLRGFAYTRDDGTSGQPTLSAGLVIAHHLEPLEDALRLVREAEKIAKSVKDKDALAITLCKRSGADFTVKGKTKRLVERLGLFTTLHYQDKFSDGAAYKLQELYLQVFDPELEGDTNNLTAGQKRQKSTLQRLLFAEAQRILGRGKISQDSASLGSLMGTLVTGDLSRDKEELLSVHDLAQELILTRLLAQAHEQARGKFKPQAVDV